MPDEVVGAKHVDDGSHDEDADCDAGRYIQGVQGMRSKGSLVLQNEASHGVVQAAAGYQRNDVYQQKKRGRGFSPSGENLCCCSTENRSHDTGEKSIF